VPAIRRDRGRETGDALLICERAGIGRAAAINVNSWLPHNAFQRTASAEQDSEPDQALPWHRAVTGKSAKTGQHSSPPTLLFQGAVNPALRSEPRPTIGEAFVLRSWLIVAAVVAQQMLPASLRAQTFDVKLPEVKQGYLELGLDNSVLLGLPRGFALNRSAHDQSIDYGLRDWWRLSGVIKLENPDETDFRVARAVAENLFVVKPVDEKRSADVGLGWFVAVEASVHQDTTNALFVGPIVTLSAQKFSFTVNPFLEQHFGRNRVEGVAFTYGSQAKYELRDGFAVGIETYGRIENLANPPPWSEQEHVIGPVIYTEIALARDFKITPDVGILFGLTSATPNVALKLNVGIPLHQPARR